ncbi:MAG: 50S ribosomal protein L20 [Candidatus Omnitrophica bacterium]|nr:50S ribosomal protein L20 [Candidatus Omnitrophota bacterium]
MVRVRHAATTHKRKKRVLKRTKGQFAQKHNRYRQAKRSLIKGMAYAFRDRKAKTRQFRQLWVVRINAACRAAGISYSRFINGLKEAKVAVNRKIIADLAVNSPDAFLKLVELAKKSA